MTQNHTHTLDDAAAGLTTGEKVVTVSTWVEEVGVEAAGVDFNIALVLTFIETSRRGSCLASGDGWLTVGIRHNLAMAPQAVWQPVFLVAGIWAEIWAVKLGG